MPNPLPPWELIALIAIPALLVGGLLAWLSCRGHFRQQLALEQRLADQQQDALSAMLDDKQHQLGQQQQQVQQLHQQIADLQQHNQELYTRQRELKLERQLLQKNHQEKLQLLTQAENHLKEQFSHLAQQIFEQRSQSFQDQNKSSLDALLTPLKEQLGDFRGQIQQSYENEAKQRHLLQHEIQGLKQLNQQMAEDAVNLTRALKGDNKQQGNWGEVVLDRILQESGLREGHEYHTQAQHHSRQGKLFRPDVVVHLPEEKDIVIDSKMSLTAFERYMSSDDEVIRQQALNEHLASIRQHIRDLGKKDYHQLTGLRSLDYVLMFMPVEPAFMIALEKDPGLLQLAMQHNIMLVSPTNLLVALRTIHNLWRYEHQNRNSQIIAERAARLYDKLRLFVEEMSRVGNSLDKARESHRQAMKKLNSGRGNLLRQAESFRELGVTVKKPIAPELLASEESELPPITAVDPQDS